MRADYPVIIFLSLVLCLSLLVANLLPPAFAAELQSEPVVTRSYVQEAVERQLAPLQQEIEQAKKRLTSLEQRLNNL